MAKKKPTDPTGFIRFTYLSSGGRKVTLPYFGYPTADNIVKVFAAISKGRKVSARYAPPVNELKSNRGYVFVNDTTRVADFEIISGPDVSPAVSRPSDKVDEVYASILRGEPRTLTRGERIASSVAGLGPRKLSVKADDYENALRRLSVLSGLFSQQFQQMLDKEFAALNPKDLALDNFDRLLDGGFVVITEAPAPLQDVHSMDKFVGDKAAANEHEITTATFFLDRGVDHLRLFQKLTKDLHAEVLKFKKQSDFFFAVSKPNGYILEDGVKFKVLAQCSTFGLRRIKKVRKS